jgi:hypothetical protein
MDISTPDDPRAPREAMLDTVAAQASAIDEIIALAEHRLCVFDIDLSQCEWQSAKRAAALGDFLRRNRKARLDLIVHDTRWLESSCARLIALLRQNSHAMTVYRTGPEARNAMDPLLIADDRHYLHRFHIEQPRAALGIEQPQLARPLAMRFEQIWATGEPGLGATVLGL